MANKAKMQAHVSLVSCQEKPPHPCPTLCNDSKDGGSVRTLGADREHLHSQCHITSSVTRKAASRPFIFVSARRVTHPNNDETSSTQRSEILALTSYASSQRTLPWSSQPVESEVKGRVVVWSAAQKRHVLPNVKVPERATTLQKL